MRIAISGAGIAGPTLAYWLTRAGHEPTVIETAPHLRTGGYVVDFWGLGYEVACRMGIESTIRDLGYDVATIRSAAADGRIRASLATGGIRRATHDKSRIALLDVEFSDCGWECARIIDALGDAEDLYLDVVSQIRLDRWSQGRTVLVGDAAACISLLGGEGTGLAMTEAYVLAGELATHNDHRDAFAAYESALRPLIADKQANARRYLPVFLPKSAFGILFRDLCMRVMNTTPWSDRLLARSFSDDLELPRYPM